MTRTLWAWLLGLLVLAALAGAWSLWPRVPAPAPISPESASTAAAGAPTATAQAAPSVADAGEAAISPAVATSPSATASSAPAALAISAADEARLPAEALPLRDTYTALLELHRGGVAAGTRRLFKEMLKCRRYRQSSQQMELMIALQESGQGPSGNRMQGAMESAAAEVARLREHCDGVPEDMESALFFELQQRAAEMGDLAGLLSFVSQPAIDLSRAVEQHERIAVFRERARGYLQTAMAQASGQAVAVAVSAHDHASMLPRFQDENAGQRQMLRQVLGARMVLSPLQQLLGDKPEEAYAYARLCQRVCNTLDRQRAEETLRRIEGGLDAAARRDAEDRADALYDEHFANRPKAPDVEYRTGNPGPGGGSTQIRIGM